ncbi:MAG: MFS transporter, partial [Chloroflexi bacterium]|nr:MFS transporter [Chloroflexota bacterium]
PPAALVARVAAGPTTSTAAGDSGGAIGPTATVAAASAAAGAAGGLAGNLVLRAAASATGVALTLRVATLPEVAGAAEVGLLAGIYSATELLAAIPAGGLSDRWGRRPLLVGGALAGAMGALLLGLTGSLPLLALGRAIQGLGTGLTIPPLLGWLADLTAGGSVGARGRVMAGAEAGTAAGLLGGTVLGSVLWGVAGAAAFAYMAIAYLAAVPLLARAPSFAPARVAVAPGRQTGAKSGRFTRDGRRLPLAAQPARWRASARHIFEARGTTRLFTAWVLLNGVAGLWLTHGVYQLSAPVPDAQQFLVGRLHGQTLSAVLAGWAALFIAGALVWGPLLGRAGTWRVMRIALGGVLLACAALWLINASWAPSWVRAAAVAVFGASVLVEAGFAPAALAQLAAGADPAHRGLTMGLYSVALGLGALVGTWAGAPLAALWAMNGVIAGTALLAALALLVLARVPAGTADTRAGEATRAP